MFSSPTAGRTVSVGVSAWPVTLICSVWLVDAVDTPSDVIAVTFRSKPPAKFTGGLKARFCKSFPVNSHMPPPKLVPAENAEPKGTAEILTIRVSEPSISLKLGRMLSGIKVSSTPLVALTTSDGVSATPAMFILSVVSVCALAVPSVAMAEIERFICPLKFIGGVRVNPPNCAVVKVQLPLPLYIPAESVAPVGTFPITTDRLAVASATDVWIFNGMEVSSSPVAATMFNTGVPATAPTVTGSVIGVVTDVDVPSDAMA